MSFETRLLAVGDDPEGDPAVDEAAALLQRGELVAFPTETVYGLGGNAADVAAIDKIFAAKRRPADNPLIVHVSGADHAREFCAVWDERAEALAAAFWPGPLTLTLPATALAKRTVCRGLDTVAVRAPQHPTARALIRRSGLGLAAPSANLSGKPSPTLAQHVWDDLAGRIPLILDGGPCQVGIESTVLDLSGPTPTVLRPGMATPARIKAAIGGEVAVGGGDHALKRSPGARYRHYSPDARVHLLGPAVSDEAFARLLRRLAADLGSARLGYVGHREPPADLADRLMATAAQPAALGGSLYAALRAMDRDGAAAIVIDGLRERGFGAPVMDRLKRAASFYFTGDAELEAWINS